MNETVFRPVAVIRTDFPQKFGVPRQSGRVPSLVGRVVFLPAFRNPDALRGIGEFSHLWLLFDFSLSHRGEWSPTVRPPRLGGNTRVGVFASRSPFRPNPIGLSSVRLLGTEETAAEGPVLLVGGADLVDGTPIFDIKPYLPFTDAHPDAACGYADAHREDRLAVECPSELLSRIPEPKRETLLACLAEDPRPSYQEDARVSTVSFAGAEVSFTVSDGTLHVTDIGS